MYISRKHSVCIINYFVIIDVHVCLVMFDENEIIKDKKKTPQCKLLIP